MSYYSFISVPSLEININRQAMLVFWVVTPCGQVTSTLKTEAVCSFEMLLSTCFFIWYYNAEDQEQNLQCRENVKYHTDEDNDNRVGG
jgi:hypothetical protein